MGTKKINPKGRNMAFNKENEKAKKSSNMKFKFINLLFSML